MAHRWDLQNSRPKALSICAAALVALLFFAPSSVADEDRVDSVPEVGVDVNPCFHRPR